MHNPWDNRPNFTRLPAHLREQVVGALPRRPNEVTARVMLFRKVPGLNYNTGRVLISDYRYDPHDATKPPTGAQVDAMDPNGRIPLVSIVLNKNAIPTAVENLIRAFLASGGTEEELAQVLDKAKKPLQGMGLTTYYEDEGSRD